MVADRNIAGAEETRGLMEGTDANSAVASVDVSNASQVRQMVDDTVARFGRLDLLVNGAAILIRTPPLVEVDDLVWDLTMDTNLKGLFYCCKYAIPEMLKAGGGSIVNIASMSGIRGIALLGALRSEQGGRDPSEQGGRGPIYFSGSARQLHRPRRSRHTPDAGQHRQYRDFPAAERRSSPGEGGPAGRDSEPDYLAIFRGGFLRQRQHLHRGRRRMGRRGIIDLLRAS